MFDFEKLDGEEVLFISDVILKKEECDKNISSIVTNKRLLLFDFLSDANDFQEALRISHGLDYIKKKEVILSVFIDDIARIINELDYDKYILKNGDYFFIKGDGLSSFLRKFGNLK